MSRTEPLTILQARVIDGNAVRSMAELRVHSASFSLVMTQQQP